MSNTELIEVRDKNLNWLNNARDWGGGFISAFAQAFARADIENLRILMPAFQELRNKYPHYDVRRG